MMRKAAGSVDHCLAPNCRGRAGKGAEEQFRAFAAAVLVLLTLLLAGGSLLRNTVWASKLALWSDVAQKSPSKSRAHNNLGNCYMLLGRPFPAIEQYKKAVELDPKNIEAYYNLGLNLENVGILNRAFYYYSIFCQNAPPGYSEQRKRSCDQAAVLGKNFDRSVARSAGAP